MFVLNPADLKDFHEAGVHECLDLHCLKGKPSQK